MKIFKVKYLSKQTFLSEKQNIAVQGYKGSFHQQAAKLFFGKEANIIYYSTFKDVVKAISENGKINGGVMAIENSIAGSIISNYVLLQQNNLNIIGEVYLKIDQYLLANPGVTLQDITEVYSHPMAILQCQQFLSQFQWNLIETNDTALSARYIHQYKRKHTATIASKYSAKLYDLNILSSTIQTVKVNYTRFLVLQNSNGIEEIDGADKASIYFSVRRLDRNMAKILVKFAEAKVKLKNLQSVLIPGNNLNYGFHVDLLFDKPEQLYKILKEIKPYITELKIYGLYKAAELPVN